MAYSGLDTRRSIVLLSELDEAVALVQTGLRTLSDLHHVSEEHASVLTLLSIGSEKLLKIVLGLSALDAGRTWPSVKEMKAHGHGIVGLNTAVMDRYRNHLADAVHTPYVAGLIAACDADTRLSSLLTVLDRWGSAGRFYRLDDLAGSPQSQESAQTMWEELESEILDANPRILSGLGTPHGYDEARAHLNEELRQSYMLWWTTHARAWMHGMVGPTAKSLSATLTRIPLTC